MSTSQQKSNIKKLITIIFIVGTAILPSFAQNTPTYQKIALDSSKDGNLQPILLQPATSTNTARPLLVALNEWDNSLKSAYFNDLAMWCATNDWNLVGPSYRGANNTFNAIGSPLAISDIVDSVRYAQIKLRIDRKRIYVLGVSGGGHMALMLGAAYPKVFAGISTWSAVTDLAKWHAETKQRGLSYAPHGNYAKNMEDAFGGPPSDPQTVALYKDRSPLYNINIASLKNVKLDINAGITDGHHGLVPVDHSLKIFNVLAANPSDRISPEIVTALNEDRRDKLPPASPDPSYGDKRVLFRKTSLNIRITIFDGDHELIPKAALMWLSKQYLE